MKRLIIPSIFVPIVLVLLIGAASTNAQRTPALARYRAQRGASVNESQSGYDLSWYTIDGGGALNSSGGGYSLSGTIGQPDAGSMGGGTYQLNGGFWGGAAIDYKVYLPLVLKSF
jgi:hypothetical protein